MRLAYVKYIFATLILFFAFGIITVFFSTMIGDESILPEFVKYIFFIAIRDDLTVLSEVVLFGNVFLLIFIFREMQSGWLKSIIILLIAIDLFAMLGLFTTYSIFHSLDNFQL